MWAEVSSVRRLLVRCSRQQEMLTQSMLHLVLRQNPAACGPAACGPAAAAAAGATEGGGMDPLPLLVAGSKLAAASSLLSVSQLFPRVPASHLLHQLADLVTTTIYMQTNSGGMTAFKQAYLQKLVQLFQLSILGSELCDDADSVCDYTGFVRFHILTRI